MKTLAINTALASLILAGLSSSAFAYDAQINITGELNETTCLINGKSSPVDQTVNLPPLSVSSLKTGTNAWAGRVPVVFQLTDCNATGATATFENGTNISADGNMVNLATGTPATNVEVQLLNASFQPINLAGGSVTTPITNEAGTLQFYAQYFSKAGNATGGAVTSRVEFSMNYN